MRKTNTIMVIFTLLCLVVLLTPISPDGLGLVRGAPPPNTPYDGSGDTIDVNEFAKNGSITFTNGANDTQFSYLSSWYPAGYKGYLMNTEVSNLRRTEDPVPNGDFEEYDEPESEGGFWEITLNQAGLVSDLDNSSDGNPNQCLNVTLKYGQVPSLRSAYIDNVFDYTSAITPDDLTLHFDIKYSSDITTANWLTVKVSVLHGASDWSWSNTTLAYSPTTWTHHTINTGSVNGTITLRISILKQGGGNGNVKGRICFDNFHYIIGTDSKPSEVALKLNNTDVSDTVGNAGEIDIYADSTNKEEAPLANCWSTDQTFQFSSSYNVSFHYSYAMYVKSLSGTAAITTFSAPVDQNPIWEVNYTVPGAVPPSGYTGYSYGLYLRSGWSVTSVKNSTGYTITTYTYNTTTLFFKMDEDIASSGDTYSIYASALNYVLQIYPQKASSASGPWTNVSSGGYYVKGDWIRVMTTLRPIGAANNYANVSLFYPNRTLWKSNASPSFDSNMNTVTTGAWEIPQIAQSAAGSDWLITVSFDNNTQCGMRQQPYSVVIETKGTKISPPDGKRVLWGQSVFVNATWQNNDTDAYIVDASARIRYVDRNLQVQYVTLTANGQGGYSTDFSTNLMTPDRNAEIYVELFRYGYVNASFSDGNHLTFTFNLVNDINYVMIKPTQLTGSDEYTGETARTDGYTSQVRFFDPYQAANVRNDTSPWLNYVRVNYSEYQDTGGGFGGIVGEGNFVPNASNPYIFEKVDPSYAAGLQRIKYEVTMRMVGASWDYEQQNFTIIIQIVSFSTNLDAVRTTITYPPSGTGDGWTEYDTATDLYVVHVYWNEVFNLTVYFENVSTSTGLSGASVNITIGGTMYIMDDRGGGYYNYTIQTSNFCLSLGSTYLYVNTSLVDYAAQNIQIRLIVEARATVLTKDQPGTTANIPYDDDFAVLFTYNDTVPATPIPITDATWSITGYVAGFYDVQNNGDGTYTVTFFGNVTEATYYVTITFNRVNYTSQDQYYEITVRFIYTQSSGSADPVSAPWGDNVTITLLFNDTDHSYLGIPGATITFNWQDNIQGVDYWLYDNADGSYTIILNTTKVAVGTHGFSITFNFTLTHYDFSQIVVSFQVRDRLTALYIVSVEPGTSVPWGDNLTIYLTFNDTDNNFSPVSGATISCDWDLFYWSYSYNATINAYVLIIETISRDEGSYTVYIYASRNHYQTSMTLQGFVVREIQTSYTADPLSIFSHPWGDNATITIDYMDLDHGGYVPYADVEVDWNATYFTIYYYGNGTYVVELNTTCREIGAYTVQIILSRTHYTNQSIQVSLTLRNIQTGYTVDPSYIPSNPWGDSVNITVDYLDLDHGGYVLGATVISDWNATYYIVYDLGNGTYIVELNTTCREVGTYTVTITLSLLHYDSQNVQVSLTLRNIQTGYTVDPSYISSHPWGDNITITVDYTDVDHGGYVLGATVNTDWNVSFFTIYDLGNGTYVIELNTTCREIGSHTITITLSRLHYASQTIQVDITLRNIQTGYTVDPSYIPSHPWGDNATITVDYTDLDHGGWVSSAIVVTDWNVSFFTIYDLGNGTYVIELNTTCREIGTYTVTITMSRLHYTIQNVQVDLTLRNIQTDYSVDPSSIPSHPWGDNATINVTYIDADHGGYVLGATVNTDWNVSFFTIYDLGNGTYVIELNTTCREIGTYTVTITLSRLHYTSQNVQVSLTLRNIQTSYTANPLNIPSNPWGDNTSITIDFLDIDHGGYVLGATVNTDWNVSFFTIYDFGDGTYVVELNTTCREVGTYTVTITLSLLHYDSQNVQVSLTLRNIQTGYTVDPSYISSHPWGDNITITIDYMDVDHGGYVLGAIVSTDWNVGFFTIYDLGNGTYVVELNTTCRALGSHTITIMLSRLHYVSQTIEIDLTLRNIQTNYSADPSYIASHPWGDNITILVNYTDVDHGVYVLGATVVTDWNASYYTIYDFGNGTYVVELNTTCRDLGSHTISITLSKANYAPQNMEIDIILDPIRLTVTVTVPIGKTTTVSYNDSVIITVIVTDEHGWLINDSDVIFRWAGHSPISMIFLGNGVYNVSFPANETVATYIVTIEASKPLHYQTGVDSVTLTINAIVGNLTLLTPLSMDVVVGDTFTISAQFTTAGGLPLTGATLYYTWPHGSDTLTHVGGGIFNVTLDTSGLTAGTKYTITITASHPNVAGDQETVTLNLEVIPAELLATVSIVNVYWGNDFVLLVYFNDTYHVIPIEGANVTYNWGEYLGSLNATGVPGYYNGSFSSTIFSVGDYEITLTVDYEGYQFCRVIIPVSIETRPTTIKLVKAEAYYEETDYIKDLEGTTWSVPRGDILRLYFNFTDDATNMSITDVFIADFYAHYQGHLEYIDGLYVAQINVNGTTHSYFVNILIQRLNYERGEITSELLLVITLIETEIVSVDSKSVITGDVFTVTVIYYDVFHELSISDATLTITIDVLGLYEVSMINIGGGYYEYRDLSVPTASPAEGYAIIIRAAQVGNYQQASKTITLYVAINPVVSQVYQYGIVAALLGILVLGAWLAYTKVFSIPWLVRKMRKMSRTLGRGKTPSLSGRDVGRIATRPESMAGIAEPAYDGIGIAIPVTVLPTVLALEEREAEDEALWRELEALAGLGRDQKLELFEEMKRIPPKDRVWFLEDLKAQMADGSRFDRPPSTPTEALEVPPGVDPDFIMRLDAIVKLTPEEKAAVVEQLKGLSKKEQMEVILALEQAEDIE